jgi:hypothetical protein
MPITRLQILLVLSSGLLYFFFFHLNQLFFSSLEHAPGVNWIFLPAGLRLLFTLLFAGEGAIGLLLASSAIMLLNPSSMDSFTSFGAACISAGAPYLAYRLARMNGIPASLHQLTPGWLSILIVIYAAMSSFLHQVWYVERGVSDNLITGFGAMFTGDLIGTLIVIYTIKMLLALGRNLKNTQ